MKSATTVPKRLNKTTFNADVQHVDTSMSEDGKSEEDVDHWKPGDFGARTTTTLTCKTYLRATSCATLLEGFGHRLRGTSGGIGIAKTSGEDEYQRSFAVDQVEYFLSHSWHANWRLKFLTLLFYFNLIPAVFFSTCAVSVVIITRLTFIEHEEDCEALVASLGASSKSGHSMCMKIVWVLQQCSCVIVGISTFCVMLLSWHHLRKRLPANWCRNTIFLDKVCIHQTNMKLKEQGIKSIGGILANSRKLLVVWDPTYFARLWCCYEMCAYMFTKGTSQSVIVAPIQLGGVSSIMVLYQICTEIVWFLVLHLADVRASFAQMFYCALWFVTCVRVEWRFRKYLKDIADLDAQLATFSVQHTECFCCKSNHINPVNGERLPCDRKVVYNSIMHWQGAESVDQGLRGFDDLIRGSFKEYVGKALGSAAPIPYRVALAVGTISACSSADYHLLNQEWGKLSSLKLLVGFLNCQFLQIPVHCGILMVLLKRTYSSSFGHFLPAVICTLSLWVNIVVKDVALFHESRFIIASFVILEILGVWWLFFAVSAENHEVERRLSNLFRTPAAFLRDRATRQFTPKFSANEAKSVVEMRKISLEHRPGSLLV